METPQLHPNLLSSSDVRSRRTKSIKITTNRLSNLNHQHILNRNHAQYPEKMASYLGLPTPLVKPVAALAGWTFVMEAWMYGTRLPAMHQYEVSMDPAQIKEDMNTKIPIKYRQIADNYNHLHEQPTTFFAVALALTIVGDNHKYTKWAAWGYVGTRIVHSLFQSLVNKILVRFSIFATSSVVLAGLTGRLAQLVF